MGKYLRCNIIPASLNDRPRIRFHESTSPSQPSLRLCSSKKNNVRADSPVTNKGTQVTAFSLLSGRRNSLIRGTAAPHSWTTVVCRDLDRRGNYNRGRSLPRRLGPTERRNIKTGLYLGFLSSSQISFNSWKLQ